MKKSLFISLLFILTISLISCDKEDPIQEQPPIDGATTDVNMGGQNEKNQVYIDLSKNENTQAQRDSWDLAFYNGNEYRVKINFSTYMAVKQLDTNDLAAVNTANVQDYFEDVAVATFDPTNMNYIDSPDGSITGTAIAEISATNAENKVYLVNLGNNVSTVVPSLGFVDMKGTARGWKKMRIIRDGNGYKIMYANLDDTTYQTKTISKGNSYHFKFFSFTTNNEVNVERPKYDWDLCFTTFANEIPGSGSYMYPDYVLTNNLSNVASYKVDQSLSGAILYENFTKADVVETNFATERRTIGSSWRNGGGPGVTPYVKTNLYYIVKDADGNYYKLKFSAMTNTSGERGYPQFLYKLLQ
jgi:hypothetical protein